MIGNLFQLVNFGIFTALIIYVIRRFITPLLREALVKQYREMVTLYNEQDQLAVDQKGLEVSITEQEDEAVMLFKKINRWRNEVELKKKKQQQEDEYVLEQANAKACKQLKNYAVHRTYNKVAPLVAQRLEQELKHTFKDEAEGHAYINSVLDSL